MTKKQRKKERNPWKIVSLVFIVLFIAMLSLGAIRAHSYQSEFVAPTPEQVDAVQAVISDTLESNGETIDDYEIVVSTHVRKFGLDKSQNILQVMLHKGTEHQWYLVDVDSGEIVTRSTIQGHQRLHSLTGKFLRR